jgi:DNA (cytosine-5)-methyltransferase 1
MLRVLDLCAGIGGFSLGLERTGEFKTAALSELDPFAAAVLEKHWLQVPCYPDVRRITSARLEADGILPIDCITAGFPCQNISRLGDGAGIMGEKSVLWKEIARIIGEVRPRYVIAENVERLRWCGLDVVLRDLAGLRYDAEWAVIPASAVGAPHPRPRVWIVAYPSGDAIARSVLGAARISERLGSIGDALRRHWDAEPLVARMAHGVPDQLDRNRCLGNAVVPQVVELIGHAILSERA